MPTSPFNGRGAVHEAALACLAAPADGGLARRARRRRAARERRRLAAAADGRVRSSDAATARGFGPNPFPMVITHAWPSCFAEMLKLVPLLTDPAAHGGDPADAFDGRRTSGRSSNGGTAGSPRMVLMRRCSPPGRRRSRAGLPTPRSDWPAG